VNLSSASDIGDSQQDRHLGGNVTSSGDHLNDRVRDVFSFDELLNTKFSGSVNALRWKRQLEGDFEEVVRKLSKGSGIVVLEAEAVEKLPLSKNGRKAANALLADQSLLRDHGLDPVLNCIFDSVRSPHSGVVPTDVMSFHVDSAPIEVDTWLSTYLGACSEGLLNEEAIRKVDIPEIRSTLLSEYGGSDDEGFLEYLSDQSYNLHYQPKKGAKPYAFGTFTLWKIATLWPQNPVSPCIHRAPENYPDAPRLLLIS
jgi:hypothetical protein